MERKNRKIGKIRNVADLWLQTKKLGHGSESLLDEFRLERKDKRRKCCNDAAFGDMIKTLFYYREGTCCRDTEEMLEKR